MADPAETTSHRCIGCGTSSPATDTSFTLISSRYGWRLSRRLDDGGQLVLEWRCPSCWAKHKDARGLARTPLDGVPAATAKTIESPAGWSSGAEPSSSTRARMPSWTDEAPSSTREPPSTTRRKT